MSFAKITSGFSEIIEGQADRLILTADTPQEMENLKILKKLIGVQDEGDRIIFDFPSGSFYKFTERIKEKRLGISMKGMDKALINQTSIEMKTEEIRAEKILQAFFVGFIQIQGQFSDVFKIRETFRWFALDYAYQLIEINKNEWFQKGQEIREKIKEKIKQKEITGSIGLLEYILES